MSTLAYRRFTFKNKSEKKKELFGKIIQEKYIGKNIQEKIFRNNSLGRIIYDDHGCIKLRICYNGLKTKQGCR